MLPFIKMNDIHETCAISGEGVLEGLEWITNVLKERTSNEETENDVGKQSHVSRDKHFIKTTFIFILAQLDQFLLHFLAAPST